MEYLRGFAAVAFTFGFAIFIHELGHFVFAKLFGVRVDTFSIGFGRMLWKRKWGDTVYGIGWIPFGGYVKMHGIHSREMETMIAEEEKAKAAKAAEEPVAAAEGDKRVLRTYRPGEPMEFREVDTEPAPAAPAAPAPQAPSAIIGSVMDDLDALRAKPYWQKLLVYSAGCINNFLTAVVVYFLLAWIGHHRAAPLPAVLEQWEYLPAETLALRPGDRVVEVDGKAVKGYQGMLNAFDAAVARKPGAPVAVRVQRDGSVVALQIPAQADPSFPADGEKIVEVGGKKVASPLETAKLAAAQLEKSKEIEVTVDKGGARSTRRVAPIAATGPFWLEVAFRPRGEPFVALPLPNLPAEKAGFRPLDTVVEVDGKPVQTQFQATAAIRAGLGRTIPVTVERKGRGGATERVVLNVEVRPDPENPKRGQIGIAWGAPPTDYHKLSAGPAVREAFQRATGMIINYVTVVKQIFQSSFQTIRENIGGPIAIAQQSYTAAQQGVVWFFEMFAMFNIVLAFMNLLPIPILDGGHIVFATIETIIRRPLPARFQVVVYNVFFALFMGLVVLVFYNDIVMNAWRVFQ